MNRATPPMLIVSMAVRQLRARPALALVASLGVALGVLALVVTSALLWGAKLQFEAVILKISPDISIQDQEITDSRSIWEQASDANKMPAVELHHASPSVRAGQIKMPNDFMNSLRQRADVAAVSAVESDIVLMQYGSSTRSIELRGIRLDEEERIRPLSTLVIRGDWRAIDGNGSRVAVGSGLSHQLGVDIGDAITLTGTNGVAIRAEVVAVFETQVTAIDDGRIYIDLRTAQQKFGKPDVIREISVRLHDASIADSVAVQIEKESGYRSRSWQAQSANFLSLLAVQRRIGSVIMAGVVLLSAFGILAVQIMVVMQKRRDIAILRAVGFQRADILRLFLYYGTSMAVLGGITGAASGKLIIYFLKNMKIHMEGITRGDSIFVADVLPVYVIGVGFAMGAGLLASIVPALSASRVEPVNVLRDQLT